VLSHRKASLAVLLAQGSAFGAFSPFFVTLERFLSRLNFGTKKGFTANSFTHGEQQVERNMTYESHSTGSCESKSLLVGQLRGLEVFKNINVTFVFKIV